MKTAIISPSGKFYGSEQTLFHFLSYTQGYDVYIKNEPNGLFEKLKHKRFKHNYFIYNKLPVFYILLCFKLLFKYKKVYINEAGHSKYVIALSKLFFWKSFYIHVRLTEDTIASRWKDIAANVYPISTSNYIADLLENRIKVKSEVISSPARAFKNGIKWNSDFTALPVKRIGVIGRLTTSKGIREMIEFLDYLEVTKNTTLKFHFYGDVDKEDEQVSYFLKQIDRFKFVDVSFEGFVSNKSDIYDNIDLVMHFNKEEPLGVIFLEALNQGKPFIGFNSGGIGCIAENLKLESQMINISNKWCLNLIENIESLDISKFKEARKIMLHFFSPKVYCERLEKLIK